MKWYKYYLYKYFMNNFKNVNHVNLNEMSQSICFHICRNQDFQEVTVESEGKPPLKMALAYGFRNIQNIVQKIKRGKCPYHFVEIMACPSGCNNGGGQLKPEDEETVKERLGRVSDLYNNVTNTQPDSIQEVEHLYTTWLQGQGSEKSTKLLQTQYHGVEKATNALTIKW